MSRHRLAQTLCIVVLSVLAVSPASAYPTTARSGKTTVTGAYNPLDLDLYLVETYTTTGNVTYTSELDYTGPTLAFTGVFTGTFTTSGASNPGGDIVSGNAGYWVYSLFVTDGVGGLGISEVGGGPVTITVSAAEAGVRFGSFRFLEGGDYDALGVPFADTPLSDDVFRLFTTGGGGVLEVVASDPLGSAFDLSLLQSLRHVGPYADGEVFDPDRAKAGCGQPQGTISNDGTYTVFDVSAECGLMTELVASSVPEPATLALLGLGLAGLGLRRRAA